VWFSGIVLGAVLLVCAPSVKAEIPSYVTYQSMIGGINANDAIDSTNRDSITTTETHWAGRVMVPPTTGTSLVIQNPIVNAYSAIIIAPEDSLVTSKGVTVTSVSPGTFIVSLPNVKGTDSGRITALMYRVINTGSDWSYMVTVPSSVGTSLVIKDAHVNDLSAIMIFPICSTVASDGVTVTSMSAGSFTVGSKNAMGSGVGAMTAINYLIVNH
jgi:hypothetical protein